MGKISAEPHSGERLTVLEKEIKSIQESIAFLGSATDSIPMIQEDLSLLKDQATSMGTNIGEMQDSLRQMEELWATQFGENQQVGQSPRNSL